MERIQSTFIALRTQLFSVTAIVSHEHSDAIKQFAARAELRQTDNYLPTLPQKNTLHTGIARTCITRQVSCFVKMQLQSPTQLSIAREAPWWKANLHSLIRESRHLSAFDATSNKADFYYPASIWASLFIYVPLHMLAALLLGLS